MFKEFNTTNCPSTRQKKNRAMVRIHRSGMISFSNDAVKSMEITEGGGGNISPRREDAPRFLHS